jgi:2-amino-4-hydroxy-6-hydroxymethyldihydropteridine diphosphokinase
MIEAVILGGGNCGDTRAILDRAEQLMAQRAGEVISRSEWHTTEPWGFECSDSFTNRAYTLRTALSAEELIEVLLSIEAELGRNRRLEYHTKVLGGQEYAARVIDLDILLFGREVVVTPHLQIPHPLLLKRDFALAPMCQAMGITVEEGVELVKNIILNDEI